MITTTVIAIALGLTPIDASVPAQVVSGDYGALVGRYSQTIDRRGNIHARGFDPRNGAPYVLTISDRGDVEAEVGEQIINFRIQPAQ